MTNRIIICKIRENLNHGFDHLLIETTLNISINIAFREKKYNWDRFNKIKFENTFNQKLSTISNTVSSRFLNDYTMNMCKTFIQIIAKFIFKTIVFVKIISNFDEKCKNVRIKINQTEKAFQQFLNTKANEKIIQEA